MLRIIGAGCLAVGLTLTASAAQSQTVTWKPYGFVRTDLIFDDSRMSHAQFPMYVLSEDASAGSENDAEMSLHTRLSRIGVDVSSQDLGDRVSATGKVEIDFQNGGRESRSTPRMRHAFANLQFSQAELLIGQTWDLISPLYPAPNSDGLMWNAGNIGDRRPQVRVTAKPGNGVRFAGAIGMPNAVDSKDLDGNGAQDGFDAAIPAFQGLVEFSTATVTAGGWGHFSRENTASPVGGATQFDSWVLGGHLQLKFGKAWFKGEAFTGQNLSDIRGGIGQSVNTGTGAEIESRGGWAEIGVATSSRYSIAFGATIDDPDNVLVPVGGRIRNSTVYVVQKLRPAKPFQIGIEYLYWKTDYNGLPSGSANRIDIHTTLFF